MTAYLQSSSAPRILVVEDEQVVAMDMEMQLAAFGYEVIGIAATGKEALHLAETTEFDLVLMDIQLRGPLDGFATAMRVQRLRKLPIIFVTATGNEEAKRRAELISAHAFLSKPYRPEDLRAVISATLDQHREPSTPQ